MADKDANKYHFVSSNIRLIWRLHSRIRGNNSNILFPVSSKSFESKRVAYCLGDQTSSEALISGHSSLLLKRVTMKMTAMTFSAPRAPLHSSQCTDSPATPCLASPQPQVSCPREGPPPPSLIHMVELGFVGLLNNPKRIFAQLQKLEVKLART